MEEVEGLEEARLGRVGDAVQALVPQLQHQLEQVGSERRSLDDELRSDKRYCGWERSQLRPKDVIKELQTDVEGVGDVIEVVRK